jgi:hypothetical protein
MELIQLESVELFTDTVTSQTVYLNVLFPSKYRYYFELASNTEIPILIDHPFLVYFPQTIMVEWVPPDGTNGIYLTLESSPAFMPFGSLTVQVYIPQVMYDAIIQAFSNPINSPADLVPPPDGNASGEVEFVLLSTDAGEQIKIDLVNTSYVPEVPVTVETLQWNEILYDIMRLLPPTLFPPTLLPPPSLPPTSNFPSLSTAVWGSGVFSTVPWDGSISSLEVLPPPLLPPPLLPPPLLQPPLLPPPLLQPSSTFEFVYTVSGNLGITFIDPRYCFLREWIEIPPDWTAALKEFAGII